MSPGEIEFQRGLPAERYVAMAGGPNNSGTMDKISIYAPDGSKRDGDRESVVFRGETILVKRKTSKIFGTVFLSLSTVTSLVLSIVAVTR